MTKTGLEIVEGVSNGLAPFTEPSKRNIGLLMERERGVENKPYRYSSLSDDRKLFGGYTSSGYGATVVRNLFNNSGRAPVTIFGVRVVGSASTAATITKTIAGVSVTFTAAQAGSPDKGTWGNDLDVVFHSYNYTVRNNFFLQVYYKGKVVETYSAATCADLQAQINANSFYVSASFASEIAKPTITAGTGTITVTTSSDAVTGVGTNFNTSLKVGSLLYDSSDVLIGTVKTITSDTALVLEANGEVAVTGAAFKFYLRFTDTSELTGGTYTSPVESDFYPVVDDVAPTGLACFDGIDVQLVASTEFHTLTMATVGKAYALANKFFYVAILPLNASSTVKQSYANTLQGADSSFIACYNLWAKVSDELGGYVTVPALGHILGAAFLKSPYVQGDFIQIPPAGIDSAMTDLIEVYPLKVSQATLDVDTQELTINNAGYIQGVGYYIQTSRTMSTNSLYHSIHTRLQASFYGRVLLNNLAWLTQKPNTPDLKKRAYIVLYAYFKTEYENGALEQGVPFETAVQIVCDQSNNPLGQSRKLLNIDVEYIPTEATESVKLSLNRNDGILLLQD